MGAATRRKRPEPRFQTSRGSQGADQALAFAKALRPEVRSGVGVERRAQVWRGIYAAAAGGAARAAGAGMVAGRAVGCGAVEADARAVGAGARVTLLGRGRSCQAWYPVTHGGLAWHRLPTNTHLRL